MTDSHSVLVLPEAPSRPAGTVAAWSEPIAIDSYLPFEPGPYPSFFRNRVYQGSSGRVFPLPFHERIASEKASHLWQAVHLENDWMRLVILPELGGRIHVAYDKTADYDIFYRNCVIKPALVGLAGPWISGGVEFNWPQHHRPATFLPTDVEIEYEPDGAIVVWCSDHDPFARMKGMHGVRLRPGSSRIEVDARLYNRDDRPQTFLWWANVAAAVNDQYQSFFPPDVRWVADHAKRATVTFPAPSSPYYGIDYAARRAEMGGDADRIDWYRNIPVPTSYMAISSAQEFFGGYDHGRRAGFVHWAPHEVSPGKKQWTWGNAPFGHAWDANLTDSDGPYVELMAGVYTDNQPDFAFLLPGETKTFRQVWYPIREIGPAHAADSRLAAGVTRAGMYLELGVIASESIPELDVDVFDATSGVIESFPLSLEVNVPQVRTIAGRTSRVALRAEGRILVVVDVEAALALDERTGPVVTPEEPARAPEAPAGVETIDELVYIATYLAQYRHATRSPRPYWDEVLRRDPGESRAHVALAWDSYDRAHHADARRHAEASIARRTAWTPTPRSGEAHYIAALAAERERDTTSAIARYERASWDNQYFAPAATGLARLRLRGGDVNAAVRGLRTVTELAPAHLRAANLLAMALRSLGDTAGASERISLTRALDPLDAWARHLAGEEVVTNDATIALDVAIEYALAGDVAAAHDLLDLADRLCVDTPSSQVEVAPLIAFHRAALLEATHDLEAARAERSRADEFGAGRCLPSRLDDIEVLRAAARTGSALACLLLGDWQYHHRDADEAIRSWQEALDRGLAPSDAAVAIRNCAVAEVNLTQDAEAGLQRYRRALELVPGDPKLLFEQDQLAARAGRDAAERLRLLGEDIAVLTARDDLVISRVNLLADVGRLDDAFTAMTTRHFQPWEGGEGQTVAAWERICVEIARRALSAGDTVTAATFADHARNLPTSLGEQRHPLANEARLCLLAGDVADALGDTSDARAHWERAARSLSDFTSMAVTPYSVHSVDSIAALFRLGRDEEARRVIVDIRSWLDDREMTPAEIDYFATSLPTMLLFDSDPNEERLIERERIEKALVPFAHPFA